MSRKRRRVWAVLLSVILIVAQLSAVTLAESGSTQNEEGG